MTSSNNEIMIVRCRLPASSDRLSVELKQYYHEHWPNYRFVGRCKEFTILCRISHIFSIELKSGELAGRIPSPKSY